MRQSRQATTSAAPRATASASERAADGRAIEVEDHLEPRVRLPADLLRFVVAVAEIAVLTGLALLAKRTASGLELDIVHGVSKGLHSGLVQPIASVAFIALLVLPVALGVTLLVEGQRVRLAEAVVTGGAAIGLTIGADLLLGLSALSRLGDAVSRYGHDYGHGPLDSYLAGLVAFLTLIGLSGRPRWRTGAWLAIGFYSLTSLLLASSHTTVVSLLLTLLIGWAVGTGLRYTLGTQSARPTALTIAEALGPVDAPVRSIRRVPGTGPDGRRYTVRTVTGERRDVTVLDRDYQAAGLLQRIYRRVRLRAQVSRTAPLTMERALERYALLTYAVEDAGVATPRLVAVLRVGPEAAIIANGHLAGTTLAEFDGKLSDDQLGRVWETVLRLHRRRVTHRALTAGNIVCTPDGEIALLEPGSGDVAASGLQLRLDLAQLLAEMALLVGPDRAARVAASRLGTDAVTDLRPLLQPIVLQRATRSALKQRKDVLPGLSERLAAMAPHAEQPPPAELERFRPRTIVTVVLGIVAGYIVLDQLAQVDIKDILSKSDWHWTLLALVLSGATYVGAALSLSGFVLERLRFVRTLLAQLAASFVMLVTPAAVGGVAVNIRYLTKADVDAADAAASAGVSQVIGLVEHVLLLIIFAAIAGTSQTTPLPPTWVWIALAALAAAVLVTLAIPAGRRLLLSRVAPVFSQLIPRLLTLAQRPAKLAEGVGGGLLLTMAYILCLAASLRAVGASVPLASVAVVYLTGNAVGSAVPTPGGIGAVEAALSAGLTAAGVPGATAVSAVLLYRLLTFWLPVPVGWAAMRYLQGRDALLRLAVAGWRGPGQRRRPMRWPVFYRIS